MPLNPLLIANKKIVQDNYLDFNYLSRGLQHADGFFTSFSLKDFTIADYDKHKERIRESAEIAGFSSALNFDKLIQEMIESIIKTKFNTNSKTNTFWCKMLFWRQNGTAYQLQEWNDSPVQTLIMVKPDCDTEHSDPILLTSVKICRIPDKSMSCKVKWLNGANSIQAQIEAKRKYGNLALMPSVNGWISDAANSCVAWVYEGSVCTPSIVCDALVGTTIHSFYNFCELNSIPLKFVEQDIETINPKVEWFLFNARQGCFPIDCYQNQKITYSEFSTDLMNEFNQWRWNQAKKVY